jgi:sugar lactone lactonase YvrE
MNMNYAFLHYFSAAIAFCLVAESEAANAATLGGETVMVSTFAGGARGYSDGIGGAARFMEPSSIAIDAASNFYVTDTLNNYIRKITPRGNVSTFAGNGESGFSDGAGRSAQFYSPYGITIDAAGNLYVADTFNHRIRKVSSKGEVSTLAGNDDMNYADGTGNTATFATPHGIAIDTAGNLYVADSMNSRIRRVTPQGEVSTFASSTKGFVPPGSIFGIRKKVPSDETAIPVKFGMPRGVAIDAAGNFYVTGADRIFKITPTEEVSLLAGGEEGFADGIGSAARFNMPRGIAIDAAGNLYVADMWNHRIRKVTQNGEVSTLAGSGATGRKNGGFADGPGSAARFNEPLDIAIDKAGNLYVADSLNSRIRKLVFMNNRSTKQD